MHLPFVESDRCPFPQNDIPVFCPALTDGSLGDMIYFHTYKNPGLIIDIVGDIRRLNDMSVRSKKAGMIVLGGGVCKHQIANAMLFVSPGPVRQMREADGRRLTVYMVSNGLSAKRSRLRGVYQHGARVRWFGFWSPTGRSCLLGQNPSGGGSGQGQPEIT